MKISKSRLKHMILEELKGTLHEEQEELEPEERERTDEWNMIQDKMEGIESYIQVVRDESKELVYLFRESDEEFGYDQTHSGQAVQIFVDSGKVLRAIKKLRRDT